MTEQRIMEFICKIEKLCEEYGAHCDLLIKKKPMIEHVNLNINAKVEKPH